MISINSFLCCKKAFIHRNTKKIYEKSNETSLSENNLYSKLNIEGIGEAEYMHVKRVRKDFEIKNLGSYNGFYFQSNTLLLLLLILFLHKY